MPKEQRPHPKLDRVKIQFWMPGKLYELVEQYAAAHFTRNHDAIKRLVVAGLKAEEKAEQRRGQRQRRKKATGGVEGGGDPAS